MNDSEGSNGQLHGGIVDVFKLERFCELSKLVCSDQGGKGKSDKGFDWKITSIMSVIVTLLIRIVRKN